MSPLLVTPRCSLRSPGPTLEQEAGQPPGSSKQSS